MDLPTLQNYSIAQYISPKVTYFIQARELHIPQKRIGQVLFKASIYIRSYN